MKEIVVISGKGGTGKTSITAALAYLNKESTVVADCDVDAADMHLLLKPDFANPAKFYSGYTAIIDQNNCIKCNKCRQVCAFGAINYVEDQFFVNELDCEGCGYCYYVCPSQAIKMEEALSGETYISKTRMDNTLVHAQLAIGADNSGKLVTRVKDLAKKLTSEEQKDYLLVDGTPGIGCPVTASVTGSDFVVVVTEASISGMRDLKRAYELVRNFSIPLGVIINKSDLNPKVNQEIKEFLKEQNIPLLADFEYNPAFINALTDGITVSEFDKNLSCKIQALWNEINRMV
ncbi:MAG: ATP-binding protein [Bacteroidota bacterium]